MTTTSTVLNTAEKLVSSLSEYIYRCPSCKSDLTIESQVVRERGGNYIVERLLKCSKCGIRIRQNIYINKINLNSGKH